MSQKRIPKSLHSEIPTSEVEWNRSVRLAKSNESWPSAGRPRRGAVSSFGVSGTNAHMVVEEASEQGLLPDNPTFGEEAVAWGISARSANALKGQASKLIEWLDLHPSVLLADVGYSLFRHRTIFAYRVAIVARTKDQFVRRLKEIVSGDVAGALHGVVLGDEDAHKPESPAFKLCRAFLGGEIEESALADSFERFSPKMTRLPTYSFEKKRYWLSCETESEAAIESSVSESSWGTIRPIP